MDLSSHIVADIAAPPSAGNGVNRPPPSPRLAAGYVEEEYLIAGTATRFDAVDTPNDGRWTVEAGGEAAYRTRVIVRRPTDPKAFNGTVMVEWFNVSAGESSPDWGFLAEEITREGAVYLGVSVQQQGVEGGDTVLEVDVDEEQVGGKGAAADRSGLKSIDPDRYGTLVHPGDEYAYDIFRQVGQAVSDTPELLLGDLEPACVIAMGESQSATFLTTYINTVHPLAPVFDGFLVHSRLGIAAPLDGEYFSARSQLPNNRVEEDFVGGVQIRSDVSVPVMVFETETDVTFLGYSFARQPDTDTIRTWEVAGTSHADAHFIRAVAGGPRDPDVGSLLGCGPVNTGPQAEVLRAAANHLVAWAAGGSPPPTGERLETTETEDGRVRIVRDDHGNALGGVRNPMVDVPAATLSGDPPSGASILDLESGGDVCVLFGSTTPFDSATLVELYDTTDDYLSAVRASAQAAVDAGFMLQPDADALVADLAQSTPAFG